MTDSIVGFLLRVFLWGAAAIFTISFLIVGAFAAVLGGIWMLLTGRNPFKLYQTYAGFARRMPGGGFQWGMPGAATQPATEPQTASERVQERFSNPRTEVEDVAVKEVR
ncbi:hypothetical protein WGP40_01210 [Brachymonas sp. G13]|uniref:hypothetical protein n=1 Tax=Brachymonas TaxID=28219 RepID=UPI0016A5F0FD|nr:hypothetical protein [Brachymonas sp. J145]MEE1653894.1 hypothetical protein [Brachymonas sp. J145]NLX16010.1 hypothetical protein [Ramlibacter sp.]